MYTRHHQHVSSPAEESQQPQNNRSAWMHQVVSSLSFVLNWIVIPLAVFFILHNFVFQPFHVVGTSMNPTLQESDYLIVSKIDKSLAGIEQKSYIPKRNQVVVFHYPKDPTLVFVKRVIALPGERIVIKSGSVRVYNQAHPEGFDPDNGTYQTAAATTDGTIDEVIPADSIFVLGDNRTPNGSFDSRDWGDLPSSYIIGTASLRLLPLNHVRTFGELPMIAQKTL
jgi:signal peptidase I